MKDFVDDFAKKVFGATRSENQEKGLCVSCGQEALSRCYSEAGRREYGISGLCELCFDEIFAPNDNDE